MDPNHATPGAPPNEGFLSKFVQDLLKERERQHTLHPLSVKASRPHLNRWERWRCYVALMVEELGEVADAIEKSEAHVGSCKTCRGVGTSNPPFAGCETCGGDGRGQAIGSIEQVRKETMEVAALALRLCEEEGL